MTAYYLPDARRIFQTQISKMRAAIEAFSQLNSRCVATENAAGITTSDRETEYAQVLAMGIPIYLVYRSYRVGRTVLFDKEWGPKLLQKLTIIDTTFRETLRIRAGMTEVIQPTQAELDTLNELIAQLNRLVEQSRVIADGFKSTPYVRYVLSANSDIGRLFAALYERCVPFDVRITVGTAGVLPARVADLASSAARNIADRAQATPSWVYYAYGAGFFVIGAILLQQLSEMKSK